jgi:hypothetical protein
MLDTHDTPSVARRKPRAGTPSPPGGSAVDLGSEFDALKASLRELLATVLDRGRGLALDKVEDLARSLDDFAARGGPVMGGMLGGARAALQGRSMVWGAIRGAFSALSPAVKAALIAVLVLALLLLPVTVVLLLVALIVLAVVAWARSGATAQ